MIALPDTLKPYPWKDIIQQQVKTALEEDLPNNLVDSSIAKQDITGLLIAASQTITAEVLLRDDAVIAGKDWFNQSFLQIDPNLKIEWIVEDGDRILANSLLATISGSARSILTAERTALNFLQTLSATATNTWKLSELIKHTPCKLLDTRKTLPGMRMAQKYAVICGGGENHRIGLHDRFLIKENHIFSCGSINKAISTAKTLKKTQGLIAQIEIEVENLEELQQAMTAGADIIMLDNFTPENIRRAVELRQHLKQTQIKLEASGNLNSSTIRDYAETGVDFVSVGAITKSIEAVDLSLRVVSGEQSKF